MQHQTRITTTLWNRGHQINAFVFHFYKAFEDVKVQNDWQRPKNAPNKWKSKVKWQLLNEYDIRSLEAGEYDVPAADEEVAQRMKVKALYNKHYGNLEGDNKE